MRDRRPPSLPRSLDTARISQPVGRRGSARPSTDWWREFSSAELDRLQDAALANNRDLRAAIARIAQAHAQARLAQAALYPSIEAFGRRETAAPAGGPGTVSSSRDWRSESRYQAGLRANYEIDLWGRSGSAAEAALALAVASIHQRESVALTLTADVASAYFEYLSLADRIEIAERVLRSRRNSLVAVDKRISGGESAAGDAALLRVVLATANRLRQHSCSAERAFNRLALLTGVPRPS